MKYINIVFLLIIVSISSGCSRVKSDIEVNICNESNLTLSQIIIKYHDGNESIPKLNPNTCTKVKLRSISSESSLKLEYIKQNNKTTNDLDTYFEEYSYFGLITISISENNITIQDDVRIK